MTNVKPTALDPVIAVLFADIPGLAEGLATLERFPPYAEKTVTASSKGFSVTYGAGQPADAVTVTRFVNTRAENVTSVRLGMQAFLPLGADAAAVGKVVEAVQAFAAKRANAPRRQPVHAAPVAAALVS